MNTIYLNPNMVPPPMRGSYSGKKFQAIVCETMTIPADAGVWSGGTRSTCTVIRLADGATVPAVNHLAAPWNGSRRNILVKLEPGICVREHSLFCGKDMGLRFYVHPDNAAKLLPAPAAELSEHEKIVLSATCSFKANYNGLDRYGMMQRDHRYASERRKVAPFPTRPEWEAAKTSLIARGLLNKAGAVTNAGRNARPPRY